MHFWSVSDKRSEQRLKATHFVNESEKGPEYSLHSDYYGCYRLGKVKNYTLSQRKFTSLKEVRDE